MLELFRHVDAEAQAAYLRGILEGIAEGIIIIDHQGIILGVNQRAEELFGHPRQEMMGRNVSMLMPEPFSSQHDDFIRHYLESGEARIIGIGREVTGLKKSGETFPMGLAISEVKADGQHHFVGIVRDLTRRRELESHLMRARESAQASSEAKSSFLASMSHELRTPLNSIIGFSGILRDGLAGDLNDEQKKQVGIIHESGQHLLNLINDILDISKIDAGRMRLEPEPCHIGDIADAAVRVVRPLAERKGLELRVQVPELEVFNDAMKLKQLLLNLLSNAIKFTADGCVEIRAREDAGMLVLEVEDTGRGIEAGELEHVFDEFAQAGQTIEGQPGTGLGLALCRRFARIMGGDMEAVSSPGVGSIFRLRVPLRVRVSCTDADSGDILLPGDLVADKPVVLAIEDDLAMQELYRQFFHGSEFQLIRATNGRAGLEAAFEYRPDCIILDILMPEMDGWEVLAELKCHSVTAEIPVLCISVLEDRETAHAMGAAAFFVKPVIREQLLEALRALAEAPR